MSDAMYWTFGFLAFILLLVLVTRPPGRSNTAANPRFAKAQEATTEELRTINGQLTDIQQRLDSMERILKEVE